MSKGGQKGKIGKALLEIVVATRVETVITRVLSLSVVDRRDWRARAVWTRDIAWSWRLRQVWPYSPGPRGPYHVSTSRQK